MLRAGWSNGLRWSKWWPRPLQSQGRLPRPPQLLKKDAQATCMALPGDIHCNSEPDPLNGKTSPMASLGSEVSHICSALPPLPLPRTAASGDLRKVRLTWPHAAGGSAAGAPDSWGRGCAFPDIAGGSPLQAIGCPEERQVAFSIHSFHSSSFKGPAGSPWARQEPDYLSD